MNTENANRMRVPGLKVKTRVKAGLIIVVCKADNHNQTVARGLKVKSSVKAGLIIPNY